MVRLLEGLRRRLGRSPTQEEDLGRDGPLTAMVIMAHPDDAEFLCAGTVAKWVDQGWTVHYVLATSGEKGTHDPALSLQQLAALREQEQRAACQVLGVKECIFLGYPDGFLENTAELRGQLVRLMRRYRPDVVIGWDGFRRGFNHSDHRNIGIATRDAVYPAVRDHLYYAEHSEEGLEAHQVGELLLAGTDEPDYQVDIGDYLEKKVEALLCHASQLGARTKEDLMERWRERARQARGSGWTPHVESFRRVRIGPPPREGARR
jgi:LmbE family N-acetylglucosaminyl deacetylase